MNDSAVRQPEHSIVETLQSLIVAFVLAMTFRGFVTEGFVIPTGSMAPTLFGQHKSLRAEETGWPFRIGYDPRLGKVDLSRVPDPMLGPMYPGSGSDQRYARTKMGDRILVLKSLYPFSDPDRYDVIVFKNPTNPHGDDGNYIKRLIGLPNQATWLVDGDVFAAPGAEAGNTDAFDIQRKPEHVQRAVWQPIFDADFLPIQPDALDRPYHGPPWTGDAWLTEDRSEYRCETAEPSEMEWDNHVRVLDDWAPYNVLLRSAQRLPRVYVNDVRVSGTIVPDGEGLVTTMHLESRGHQMEFVLSEDEASIRLRSAAYEDDYPDEGWTTVGPFPVDTLRPGRPANVEFWHADQQLSLYVDDKLVAQMPYAWSPEERLRHATGRLGEDVVEMAGRLPARPPRIRWRFEGSPVTLKRVRLDRDIFYRQDQVNEYTRKNPAHPDHERSVMAGRYAFGTHPDNLAILGEDQFFMCGDNSTASSDSRLWGSPHPMVATQIDPAPFIVNRKMLLGKAWVVYFPAPHSITKNGKAFVPDFGQLRFIR